MSVWVFAEGTRGYYRVGYLPKLVAAAIAPLLDKGTDVSPEGFRVIGGAGEGFSYGAIFAVAV